MMEIFEVQYQYMKHVDNVKKCIIRELQVRITIFKDSTIVESLWKLVV